MKYRLFSLLFFVTVITVLGGCSGFQASGSKPPPPDMTLDIQGLIDNAQDGSTIEIPYGRYVFKDNLLIRGRKNITFRCAPGTRILIENARSNVLAIQDSHGILIENAYLRHLKPLEKYGCHGGVIDIHNSAKVEIVNCELNGCGAVGVSGALSNNILIRNCFIHHNTFIALDFSSCKDVNIQGCVIEENGSLMALYETDAFHMAGNIIRNNGGIWREYPLDPSPGIKGQEIKDESQMKLLRWEKWQKNFEKIYNVALNDDIKKSFDSAVKFKVWQNIIDSFSEDNPYSTGDEVMRKHAKERLEYWKAHRESSSMSIPFTQKPHSDDKQFLNKYTVLEVEDKDTLRIHYRGNDERVELIGVDAPQKIIFKKADEDAGEDGQIPEINIDAIIHGNKYVKHFIESLVKPGDLISIEFDAQRKHEHGMLMGYVYLSNGKMLNEEIIKAGYASVKTLPPNIKYNDRFLKACQQAREKKLGLWGEGMPYKLEQELSSSSSRKVNLRHAVKKQKESNAMWTVQVISFSNTKQHIEKATNLAKAIKNMTGYNTFVSKRGEEVVVCAGRFNSRSSEEMKRALKEIGKLEYEGKRQFKSSYPIQIR